VIAPLLGVTFDAALLTSATVTVVGGTSETVLEGTSFSGAAVGGSSSITLTAEKSAAAYREKLRAITFKHTGELAGAATGEVLTHQVTFQVCHNEYCSSSTACVAVTATNDAPTIVDHEPSITFTSEEGGLRHIASVATLGDTDNQDFVRAVVTLGGAQASDNLFIAAPSGNVGVAQCVGSSPTTICAHPFDSTTQTLTIEGTGTKEQYQDAVRAIAFGNADESLETATARTIGIVLTDKSGSSNTGAAIVTIEVCGAVGTYVSPSGFATKCPVGKYQGLSCQSACVNCGVGTYGQGAEGAADGATHCQNCPRGTFQPNEAQGECTNCGKGRHGTAGTVVRSEDTTSCTSCLAGQFSSSEAAEACTDCASGTFQTGSGGEVCTPFTTCAAGETKGWPAAADLKTSDGSCSPCASGQYQSDAGGLVATCTPCPAGKDTAGATGASACTPCATGWFKKDDASAASCVVATPCTKATQYQSADATAVSDFVCEALSACSAVTEYDANAPADPTRTMPHTHKLIPAQL
jgi:hypothetical protein